ncbi:MAG: S1C family serine protease [Leptolyngbyaceae cyanobacterium]
MYRPILSMMKLHSLLLFAASAVVVDLLSAGRTPAQWVQTRQFSRPIGASEVYALANPAVVTVYAGEEIGSGSIVSPDGLVITNNHVARGSASGRVEVQTANGQTYRGQVIGSDRRNDLALIQLQTRLSLPVIRLANSTGIQIGAPVYAIGSPYGRPGVMTTGALGEVRPNGDLRSRVRLEPGNSGGPLLNSYGEMIGINKAVLETETGQNTGISFATNIAVVYNFIEQYRPSQGTPSPKNETTLAQTVQSPQLPTPLPITSQPVRMPQWATSQPPIQSRNNLSELAIEPYATIPATMLPPTIDGLAIEPYAITAPPRP